MFRRRWTQRYICSRRPVHAGVRCRTAKALSRSLANYCPTASIHDSRDPSIHDARLYFVGCVSAASPHRNHYCFSNRGNVASVDTVSNSIRLLNRLLTLVPVAAKTTKKLRREVGLSSRSRVMWIFCKVAVYRVFCFLKNFTQKFASGKVIC